MAAPPVLLRTLDLRRCASEWTDCKSLIGNGILSTLIALYPLLNSRVSPCQRNDGRGFDERDHSVLQRTAATSTMMHHSDTLFIYHTELSDAGPMSGLGSKAARRLASSSHRRASFGSRKTDICVAVPDGVSWYHLRSRPPYLHTDARTVPDLPSELCRRPFMSISDIARKGVAKPNTLCRGQKGCRSAPDGLTLHLLLELIKMVTASPCCRA